MRHMRPLSASDARRGVILMVVLVLLTLFAILGLSFVLYANAQAKSSDLYLAAAEDQSGLGGPDVDPDVLANTLLSIDVYGSNDSTGVYSANRGYELARSVFGNNYIYDPVTKNTTPVGNNVPYSGIGRVHEPGLIPTFPPGYQDGYFLINYTCYQDAKGNLVDGFLRDPERLGFRISTDLSTYKVGAPPTFAGGFNVGYTYPDANNLWLGAVRAGGATAADYGAVLIQSFHRPWMGFGSLDPSNSNWYIPSAPLVPAPFPQPPGTPPPPNPALKYMVMRPRPIDQLLANETWDYAKNMPFNLKTNAYRTNFFPPPADAGGDVKNLVGSPGYYNPLSPLPNKYAVNDSFWMDVGYPVQVARDGRKYKPLVAQLMVDLDNLVNVNVHGNIRGVALGTGNTMHVSDQAWGPWEVNLSQVMNADAPPPLPASMAQEWVNLFNGQSGPTYGRYGPDGQPGQSGSSASAPPAPRFFSLMDIDGTKLYNPSDPFSLPGTGGAPAYLPFPGFPPNPPNSSYSLNNPLKFKNHPSLNGYFLQTGDDRTFGLNNIEALLRFGDVGTDSIRSELMALCKQNLNPDPTAPQAQQDAAKKIRRLLTTLSMDYDRPAITPWLRTDASVTGTQLYTLNAGGTPSTFPTGAQIPSLNVSVPAQLAVVDGGGAGGNGEFGADLRASNAFMGKIDLNRRLTSYPPPNASGQFNLPADQAQIDAAIADRRILAKDIFDRLRFVTTGQSPITPLPPAGPQYDALRWLAQLSVNIVDFIDEDDYMTPWNWDPATPTEVVFGTELPRVVLNEAYVEYANDPTDTFMPGNKAQKPYQVNLWVELLDTFVADASRGDNGNVRLQVPGATPTPVYQIQVIKGSTAATPGMPFLANDNILGDPARADPLGGANTHKVTNFNYTANPAAPAATAGVDLNIIQASTNPPSPGAQGNNTSGYYVIGPVADFPGTAAGSAFQTLRSDFMGYTEPNTAPPPITPHGIFLQRLACPGLPPNPLPGTANYNPYITIDYIASVQANDGVAYDNAGPHGAQVPTANRLAYGRNQPYAANATSLLAQGAAPAGQPKNTFFNTNNPAKAPAFDWLTHLDRQAISPIELLHVSAFKPHELTQQFMNPAGNFQHRLAVALSNSNSRLFRAFEFFATRPRGIGASTNSRVAGRVNINTVWDIETFRALCDAQTANGFTGTIGTGDVDTIWNNIVATRTPAGYPNGKDRPPLPPNFPPGNDKPFKGFGVPYATAGDIQWTFGSDIDDTLFRKSPPLFTNGVFEVPSALPNGHPVRRWELMNKIYNNLTTRSNVFAVWMTVGFFEVIDDSTRPVKLGAEIGLTQHQNIRHRIFAIIDRTNIRDPKNQPPVFLQVPAQSLMQPSVQAGTKVLTVASLSGSYEGTPWNIQAGTQMVVDVGPNQETVTVVNLLSPTQVQVQGGGLPGTGFLYPHAEGALINLNAIPGNPGTGAQQNYDPRQDSTVVRYYNIIN